MTTAREFAIQAHGNQKYAEHPYVYHLDQVVGTLYEFGYTNIDMLNSGYLHDVLEDTDVKVEELETLFGTQVAKMVCAVTAVGNTREEKTAYTIRKLRMFNQEAIPLKMADRLANMRFSSQNSEKMFKRYCEELPKYAELFQSTNLKMYNEMTKLGAK